MQQWQTRWIYGGIQKVRIPIQENDARNQESHLHKQTDMHALSTRVTVLEMQVYSTSNVRNNNGNIVETEEPTANIPHKSFKLEIKDLMAPTH